MKTVVIDANIGISYVIPLPYSDLAEQRMRLWHTEQARIVVPSLWRYEVLSGFQKALFHKLLTFEQAVLALSDLKDMAFDEIGPDVQTDQQILRWAGQIGQMVIYDATYLALAELLDAEFWSADRRLVVAARKAGADWAYFLGE